MDSQRLELVYFLSGFPQAAAGVLAVALLLRHWVRRLRHRPLQPAR